MKNGGRFLGTLAASFGAAALLWAAGAKQSLYGAQQASQTAGQSDANLLRCSIAGNFTVADVGDLIIPHPLAALSDQPFQAAVRILKSADLTFGNFEGTAIDIHHFSGYPAAEYGGMWLIDDPGVPKDLVRMGFKIVGHANNHSTDWGLEGMKETDNLLDEAGLTHAGTGKDYTTACAASYRDTPQGRVALVSMASSYTPLSRAMDALGEAPARPGICGLGTHAYLTVTQEMFDNLGKIRDALPKGSVLSGFEPQGGSPSKELNLLGRSYRAGDRVDYGFDMNPYDLKAILKSIRQGKENSDFLIASIHAHEAGNWSDTPPAFLVALAHEAIDAGADEFIGHGPHQLRGVEIYKGKPIFYSMGNFFFQPSLEEPVAIDMYQEFKIDPASETDADFNIWWEKKGFAGEVWFQSMIAVSQFDNGKVSEIRLYPLDLSSSARWADRGIPELASGAVARTILERMQRLSAPFHTDIEIKNNVGFIKVKN